MEYLAFWVTKTGIRPINNKVKAIVNMTPPKTKLQVQECIGLINFYKDMWVRRLHLLKTLTALTSDKAKFKFTSVTQKSMTSN